jgi:hypothetical protein
MIWPLDLYDLLARLRVLRFCEHELQRRVQNDAPESWRWRARCKAACYCIGLCEERVEWAAGGADELSAEEQAQVRATHPLLIGSDLSAAGCESWARQIWIERLRRKAADYLDSASSIRRSV